MDCVLLYDCPLEGDVEPAAGVPEWPGDLFPFRAFDLAPSNTFSRAITSALRCARPAFRRCRVGCHFGR